MNMPAWFFWALLSAVLRRRHRHLRQNRHPRRRFRPGHARAHVHHLLRAGRLCRRHGQMEQSPAPPRQDLDVSSALSALATGASWVCYFRALQIGEASKVAPVDKLSLVLVALFAVVFLGERPNLREWSGIACVALGVVILSLKK